MLRLLRLTRSCENYCVQPPSVSRVLVQIVGESDRTTSLARKSGTLLLVCLESTFPALTPKYGIAMDSTPCPPSFTWKAEGQNSCALFSSQKDPQCPPWALAARSLAPASRLRSRRIPCVASRYTIYLYWAMSDTFPTTSFEISVCKGEHVYTILPSFAFCIF